MSEDIAIKVNGLSKSFKLPHEKHSSIKSAIFNSLKGGKRTYEKQEVLKNISFEVKKGEFFGIVGRNGSGKSTLLKLLAGVYSPDKGHIQINGKLTPFIELGVGFNPELTGRENVYLNGALLGFSRKEMDKMYDEIVEFAELEKFMDQSLKNYSSGMQVRLAFSIAIRARSDVLLLDEVLAVGDINFQEKCYKFFEDLKNKETTVILISHDGGVIEKYCDRVAIVDKGSLVDLGNAKDMILKYGSIMANEHYSSLASKDGLVHQGNGSIIISEAHILNSHYDSTKTINEGEKFTIVATYIVNKKPEDNVVCGVGIKDDENISVLSPNSLESNTKISIKRDGELKAEFKYNNLAPGNYKITVGLFNKSTTFAYDLVEDIAEFKVIGKNRYGKVYIEPKWSIAENN